jgi:hypothetical protein
MFKLQYHQFHSTVLESGDRTSNIEMVGVVFITPSSTTTLYRMTIFATLCVLLSSLLTSRTDAFRFGTTNVGIKRSSIIPSRSQQLCREFTLLYSSTALTSPLQPVPEESSTFDDTTTLNGNDDDDDDDGVNLTKMTTTNTGVSGDTKLLLTKQQQKLDYIKSQGGRFSFNTKYGALNPFAIYYGLTSILLGLPWFIALTGYQFVQVITLGRFDRLRRIPVHLNQLWGESLLLFTRCFPEMIHRERLQKFYKEYVIVCAFFWSREKVLPDWSVMCESLC